MRIYIVFNIVKFIRAPAVRTYGYVNLDQVDVRLRISLMIDIEESNSKIDIFDILAPSPWFESAVLTYEYMIWNSDRFL